MTFVHLAASTASQYAAPFITPSATSSHRWPTLATLPHGEDSSKDWQSDTITINRDVHPDGKTATDLSKAAEFIEQAESTSSLIFRRQSGESEAPESWAMEYSPYLIFGGIGLTLFTVGASVVGCTSYNKEGKTHVSALWSRVSESARRRQADGNGSTDLEAGPGGWQHGERSHELESLGS